MVGQCIQRSFPAVTKIVNIEGQCSCAVAEDNNDNTDLDQQDGIQINTEFKLELYKKGKRQMIAQELKNEIENVPKDRDDEYENQVCMKKEEEKEKFVMRS